MNKNELITSISEKSGLTKKDSEKALKAFTDTIQEALANNDKVQLVGFGTFDVRDVAEKSGISKLGGVEKEWTTPAHKKPSFKFSKTVKEELNK